MILLALSLGCSPEAGPGPDAGKSALAKQAGSAEKTASGACSDGGSRSTISGLCAEELAEALPPLTPELTAPESCGWSAKETPMPGGEQVLLYRGLDCGAGKTAVEVAGGAKTAELVYVTSAHGGAAAQGTKLATIIVTAGEDPRARVEYFVREAIEDPAMRPRCTLREAGGDGRPADALTVDFQSKTEVAALEELRDQLCGPFGYSDDSVAFWRLIGDFAWHFELGQDTPEIDAASFTLVPAVAVPATGQ